MNTITVPASAPERSAGSTTERSTSVLLAPRLRAARRWFGSIDCTAA